MTQDTAPLDPAVRRYQHNHHYLFHMLTAALPPPRDDRPETRAERDSAAVAEVAALCPGNAAEVALAVQCVAANLQSLDCLRLAKEPGLDRGMALKCVAQSASMMRQAQGALRTLARMQAIRKARDAHIAAADEAERTEHRVAQSLNDGTVTLDPGLELPPPPPPPTPDPAPDPETGALDAMVERYLILYPERAALIRRHGGVPADARFGPPEDTLVRAIVTGQSAALRALDEAERDASDETKSRNMRL